ncbi:signal recognition particle-docking protein FtsY [Desertimonas flava]|jgi:fused signal recognition particle receptor|uniref:signal recognition particle-docking protein FtsY n=1 Tax=Desertimonas flava TaxID=2064846 RepID=UPI000E34308E|nr:signal recognition particle-docking protein FtsY [Desertimonas flava]
MAWIYIVLIAVVILFGIGVVVWNRRRNAGAVAPPSAPTRTVDRPPPATPPIRPGQPDGQRGSPSSTAVLEGPTPDGVVAEPEVVEPEAPVEEPVEVPSLRSRMSRARAALAGVFSGVRGRKGITDETWDDLEEALLRADVGIGVTTELLDGLRAQVKAKSITEPDDLLDALREEMKSRLAGSDRELHFDPEAKPNVWLFVGVNGVGKTTSIGKVGSQQTHNGRSVLMAAGDTFRAAAAEQLATWAERSGVELVRGNEGGDPSAVVFDAVERAASRDVDLVLADTAGRLHTKTNLMEELRKVRRVAEKGAGTVTEALLVIDATTGQNGLAQAREFGDATSLTGVVLTKLDGSAKGGIVFAVETELGIPVKLVGLGETIADLAPFDPDEFVDALF